MKLFYSVLISCLLTQIKASITDVALDHMHKTIDRYKLYLEKGTYGRDDWSCYKEMPKSRYYTFKQALEYFVQNNGKIIVELGTSRSFVHGDVPGCNSNNTKYWNSHKPENWDWGAGFFTRIAAESLSNYNFVLHTVDIERDHINRCKYMTAEFKKNIRYHVQSSLDFLRNCPSESIDLLYIDTGDMTPIEPTALLQLDEAKIVVDKNLIAPNGIILIDDVRNQTPKKFGDTSGLGKAKYSLAYLLDHGFELIADEYQVILKKK